MKGAKEFNQRVFELFYLYSLRRVSLHNEFMNKLCFNAELESPEERLVRRILGRRKPKSNNGSIDLKSLNQEIRQKERVFFRSFGSDGLYPEHPFSRLCRKLSLNYLEKKIMVCLLGQALKDSMFKDSPANFGHFEEQQLLNLIFPDPELAFARMELFNNENRMVKAGILGTKQIFKRFSEGLPCEFELKPEIAQWLIGLSRDEPELVQANKQSKKEPDLLEIENPGFGLEKVVLAEDMMEQIKRAIYFYSSNDAQNSLPKLGNSQNGQAILALFYGPPGTGKTYTASAIAGELKKPLARVQFAALRNMWYGNTEKNVVSCFRTASTKKMVLLFDEADALISARQTGRGTVTDNIEHTLRNLFLQEIERFNGVVILTTNMAECLDPALERRLNLKLEFPVPEIQERERLWKKFLKKAPLADDVNFRELAEALPLSGGHIKNAVFNGLRQLAYLRKDNPSALITQSMLFAFAQKESQFLEFKDKNKILGFRR